MEVGARKATSEDLPDLHALYRGLEAEMVALNAMWPLADGLAEPVGESLAACVADSESLLVAGTIDGLVLGFLLAQVKELLPQAEGLRIGSIKLVYVDHPAREVGIGEAMLSLALQELRQRGIARFDAHVLPGHRLVKNFFEAGSFAARSIIMHHVD